MHDVDVQLAKRTHAANAEKDLACVGPKLWRNQDRDVVFTMLPVGGEILAVEMGADRHLFTTASSDRRDEVDRRRATLLLDQVCYAVLNDQFHDSVIPDPSLFHSVCRQITPTRTRNIRFSV